MLRIDRVVRGGLAWRKAERLAGIHDWKAAYDASDEALSVLERASRIPKVPVKLHMLAAMLSYRVKKYDESILRIDQIRDELCSCRQDSDSAYLLAYSRELLEFIAGESPPHSNAALLTAAKIDSRWKPTAMENEKVSRNLRAMYPMSSDGSADQ